jgi:hypothetical protein
MWQTEYRAGKQANQGTSYADCAAAQSFFSSENISKQQLTGHEGRAIL